jgi:hypothetical protein
MARNVEIKARIEGIEALRTLRAHRTLPGVTPPR